MLAGNKQASSSRFTATNKADGIPCNLEEDILQRWSEHFATALNHLLGSMDATLEAESSSAVQDPEIQTNEPTLEQVITATRKLRNGRAPGPNGIPPELLKCAIGPVSHALHTLFVRIWKSGRVPADWRDGIIMTFCKGKGQKQNVATTYAVICPREGLRSCFTGPYSTSA